MESKDYCSHVYMFEQPVNWEVLSLIWHLFENQGLTPSILKNHLEDIKSPVLIVGAGAGLIPSYLRGLGSSVTGIDASPSMIDQAKVRRGEIIIQSQFPSDDENKPRGSFASAILSSGVVGYELVRSHETLRKGLRQLNAMLTKKGCIIIVVFAATQERETVEHVLRLRGYPSMNALFLGCDSLLEAKQKFCAANIADDEQISYLFERFAEFIQKRMIFVNHLGKELERINLEPTDFIRNYTGYNPQDLFPGDIIKLRSILVEEGYRIINEKFYSDSSLLVMITKGNHYD